MSYPPPNVIGHSAEQMRFICYATLRPEQRTMANASLAGPGPREIAGVAIFEHEGGYFTFSCDGQWQVMFDNWSETLERAKRCEVDADQWVNVKETRRR